MLAMRQIAFGKAAGKGIFAKDYVQDGLVFMQDCIENAGWGVHKSGAQTEWTELVSGEKAACDVTFTDTYATANANQTISHTLALENLKSIEGTKAVTYEVIMDNVGTISGAYTRVLRIDNMVCCLHCRGGTYPYQYWPMQNLLGGNDNSVRTSPQDGDFYLVRFSVRASHDLGFAEGYQNGVFSYKKVITFSDAFSCNSITQNIKQGARMRAVRIYSRVLSAEEIAYNYEIDKVRFGL